MKYSVCIDAVFAGKGTLPQVLKKVKEAGYEAVEFWGWWDKDMEVFQKEKEALGLTVSAFCTKMPNPGDISLQKEYLEGLKESMEMAKKLGCPTLITQAGFDSDSARKGITRGEHRKVLLDTIGKAAEILEKSDITLVVEPLNILVDHPGYHLITCEDASALIDQIKSPNVKLLFDIYHQQITEGNLIRNITENIDKIGHFHAAGHPGRTELTKGEIHYRHVFEAIRELGYDRYVGLEYMTSEDPVPGLIKTKEEILVN